MSTLTEIQSQFLAPPLAEEETPVPRASDCGEAEIRKLRHPFAVTPLPSWPGPLK